MKTKKKLIAEFQDVIDMIQDIPDENISLEFEKDLMKKIQEIRYSIFGVQN